MFQTHSTVDVLAETLKAMRTRHSDKDGKWTKNRLDRITASLDEVLDDFDASVGFSGLDINDKHVHFAATSCRADWILTKNKESDFTTAPDDESYEVTDPDDFFMLVAQSCPGGVVEVTIDQYDYWKRRGGNRTLGDSLRNAGCPKFGEHIDDVVTLLEDELGSF